MRQHCAAGFGARKATGTSAIALVAAAFVGVAGGGCAGNRTGTPPAVSREVFTRPPLPGDVQGRAILALSDADMTAVALATGSLGVLPGAGRDVLTAVELPIREPRTPTAQVVVSNSVLGPPTALSLARDGRRAFVVESRARAESAGAEGGTNGSAGFEPRLEDLPAGSTLRMVDVRDPLAPQVTSAVEVGRMPLACTPSPDGRLVAVVTREDRAGLVLVPVLSDEGVEQFGTPLAWDLAELGLSDARPSSVAWSPTDNVLALCLPQTDQVVFLEVAMDGTGADAGLAVRTLGPPVSVGRYPYWGEFTPDGRHFVSVDVQWHGGGDDHLLQAPPATLSVVRTPTSDPARAVDHPAHAGEVLASATVGANPQGLAISPDGRFIVTANIGRSFLPEGDQRLESGTLSLVEFDAAEGTLTRLGEFTLGGMPEGVAFDESGVFVVVALFRSLDAGSLAGELAFWRLNPFALAENGTARASLQEADFRVGVGRGPHGVAVIPRSAR